MSAFANCILMMMKTNEWYDEKKRKNIKAETDMRHNVECFFSTVYYTGMARKLQTHLNGQSR